MLKTIQVTENDIKHGKPCNAEECAVARAIERHLNKDCQIIVGTTEMYIGGTYEKTPKVASDFIIDFDNASDAPPKPFTFTLEIPDQFLKATD